MIILRLIKKEFHSSKQPIGLKLVDTNKIIIFDKFKHSDDGFKYISLDNIIRLWCIIFPEMSGYIKYFENGGKICPSKLKMIG